MADSDLVKYMAECQGEGFLPSEADAKQALGLSSTSYYACLARLVARGELKMIEVGVPPREVYLPRDGKIVLKPVPKGHRLEPLTQVQANILSKFREANALGYSAQMRDVAQAVGGVTETWIHTTVNVLIEKGYVVPKIGTGNRTKVILYDIDPSKVVVKNSPNQNRNPSRSGQPWGGIADAY